MNASIAINNLGTRRAGPFSLNSIFAGFPEKIARKGEALTKKNHSLAPIFYLVEGMVKTVSNYPIMGREVVNGYFTNGEIMNLEAWDKNQTKTPNLVVISAKATYKVIPVQDFREMVRQNQGLNQLILHTLMDRMNKINDRLHRLLIYKSRQRVVQFLIDYLGEVGQRVGYEYVIKKPFTHEEIGNLSDTSRQTVTTVLNELKTANIIHFTRRYIVIRNLEALTEEVKNKG